MDKNGYGVMGAIVGVASALMVNSSQKVPLLRSMFTIYTKN